MRVEASRDPEGNWYCWKLPTGMNQSDAEEFFKKHVKPGPYTYKKFLYDHRTGIVRTD